LTLVGTNVSSPDIPPIPPAIAHAVVNVPQVSLERMEDWYRQCPYMITSTRYEGGHALTILEAMSFGCVVFASAIPAAREIIRHRHNGILLKGGRVDDDAEVIRDVVADRSLVDALGRHGFGTAQRNRWERQGERLMRVLERDRDGKAPGRGKTRAR
jgi:glycosyltransferase involved in cell wall biosynthesis